MMVNAVTKKIIYIYLCSISEGEENSPKYLDFSNVIHEIFVVFTEANPRLPLSLKSLIDIRCSNRETFLA